MTVISRVVQVAGLAFLATACGKKGALIYPDMLIPAAPSAVAALQSGSAVKLQFSLPDKDRAGRPLQGVTGVKISRRTNNGTQKDVCRSCTSDYILFRKLYLDFLPTDTQRFGNRLILLDSDVSAGNVYSYIVVPFTADSVDGAASSAADARMGAVLPAPVVKAESFPTEVRLQLSSLHQNTGQLLGYNLYRSSAAAPRSFLPLNKEPLKGSEYVDTQLERGARYRYTARTLVLLEMGGIAESEESRAEEGMLKDDE